MLLFELFLFLSSSKDPIAGIKSFAQCPNEDRGYEHIEQELPSYQNKNFFACNLKFKNAISLTENILLIYHCNFTSFTSNNGAIRVIATQTAPSESIEIQNCNFYNIKGESIHIEAQKKTRNVNVIDCSFEKCSSSTSAIAIYFKVTSGSIERCKFMNNDKEYGRSPNVIYYEYFTDDEGNNEDVTVRFNNNSFIIKAYQGNAANLISFDSNSIFQFTNNLVSISTDSTTATLFTWPTELTSIEKYQFEGNKMFPFNEDAIKTPGDLLKNKFEVLEHECPPNQVQEGVQITNLCDLPFSSGSSSIHVIQKIINIFHCSFFNVVDSNIELGGAIYVSLDNRFSNINRTVRIHDSDFVNCHAKHGSAIYIDCNQSSLLFDFRDCYFFSNYFMSFSGNDYNDKKGGAIYISTKFTSFEFIRCSFDFNLAGDGGAIYYLSDTSSDLNEDQSNEYEYSLRLIDCKFNRNQIKSYGGALYISMIGCEHVKPIEIESCIFYLNTAIDDDKTEVELPEKGAAIYYSQSYAQQQNTNEAGFRVINCNFKSNIATYNGGAISLFIENKEPSKSIEICKCSFISNRVSNIDDDYQYIAGSGSDIDFVFDSSISSTTSESLKNSKLLFINECDFLSSQAYFQGGSISLVIQNGEPSKSIEINDCSFTKCNAEIGGAINYRFTKSSSNLQGQNAENVYSLHVVDCIFTSNIAKYNGGAIAILIEGGEPLNPIEINDCTFLHNYANDTDENAELGGAIFYLYQIKSSTPSKILLETSDFCFGIHNCIFSENEVSYFGGAICIGFTNIEPSRHVEIRNCSFNKNIASLGVGSDIYFNIDPKTSNVQIEEELLLSVYNCSFSECSAKEYGSIYVEVESGESKRTIEFNKCLFNPINTDGLYLISTNPSIYFYLNDCDFLSSAHSFFDIDSAKIENCRFNDLTDKPIYYSSSSSSFSQNSEFCIEKCKFTQSKEIDSLVYFATKITSQFSFISNNIIILNNKTRALGCKNEIKLDENGWKFELNTINGEDELIKTNSAEIIPASCQVGFICLPDCNDQHRCDFNATYGNGDPEAEISNFFFNGLSYSENGAAIYVYNYHFYCHKSNFTSCVSNNGGGGAIYIYINTAFDPSIKLENLQFVKCSAVYGGAIFAFSDVEENLLEIFNCDFIENKANTKLSNVGDVHYGGSAIFMTVKNSEVKNCTFRKNSGSGLKIFNDFDKIKRTKNVQKVTLVSITGCLFETDEKSSSSLFYATGSNLEVPVEVTNCQFNGRLADKSYHIDGISISSKKKSESKLHINDCTFSEGWKFSVNKENSLFLLSSLEKSEAKEKETKTNDNLKIIALIIVGLACFATISSFFVYLSKNKQEMTITANYNLF